MGQLDIKLYVVSKLLKLVLAIISLLEKHNTQMLSLHLTVFLPCVCILKYHTALSQRQWASLHVYLLDECLRTYYSELFICRFTTRHANEQTQMSMEVAGMGWIKFPVHEICMAIHKCQRG